MFCTNCGNQLKEGALFCGQCGARQILEPAPAPVVETPAPVAETPAPVVEAPVVETPAPVVEAPVAETPAPVVETPSPVVEAPAPVAEAPVVETPAPVVEAPVVETPAPVVEAPVVETPAPVVEAPVIETPAPAAEPAPAYVAPRQPAYQAPVYQAPAQYQPATPEAPKKKKKKSLAWLWIVLAVLLIGAAAVLALDYFGILSIGIFGNRYSIAEEVIEYDADGNELSYMSVEFDKKGLPEEIFMENSDDSFSLELSIEFEYGKDITTAYITYNYGGTESSSTVEFDKYGNQVYVEMEGSDEVTEYEYTYDKKGNMLEKVTVVNGKDTEIRTWEYDKENNITYFGYEDLEDEHYSYEYFYDNTYKNGKLTETATYDENDELLSTEYYEYEGKNLVYYETEYADGSYTYTEYTYNKKGQLTLEVSYAEDGKEVDSTEYGYDKNGNLEYADRYYAGEYMGCTEYVFSSKKVKLTDAQENIFASLGLINIQD